MNLLLLSEIRRDAPLPGFGGRFLEHMCSKRNPDVYAASLTAWNLLAEGLRQLGIDPLPDVEFAEKGKPYFANCNLQFSLSHSASIAAALISDRPCGIDVEIIRPEIESGLLNRVLSDDELRRGENFFSVWTKKEAAAKLCGSGLPSRPKDMDLSEYENMQLLQRRITDSAGHEYFLTAVCESREIIRLIKETDC